MSFNKVFNEIPFPLFYTPIKCNNPIIIHRLKTRIDIGVDIGTNDNNVYLKYIDNTYASILMKLIKNFLDIVSNHLTQEKYSVEITVNDRVYGLGLYAVVTQWFLESIGIPKDELLGITGIIDEKLFGEPVRRSILKAIRKSLLVSKDIIYREGEEHIELDIDTLFSVKDHLRHELSNPVKDLLDEQAFRTAIIHLGGYTAIALARCFLSSGKCRNIVAEALLVFNSLQYMLKGITPPLDGVLVDDLPDYMTLLILEDEGIE